MAGKPSQKTVAAMQMILAGSTAYAAGKAVKIAPGTIYRSRLYAMWRAGDFEELTILLEDLSKKHRAANVLKNWLGSQYHLNR